MPTDRYHHGSLRRAVLDAAVEVIAESGPSALSLRDLARRAGVSHAGPAHHFGSKRGVFTALAAEGFALLAERLESERGSMADLGAAYVRFGLDHRAHFEVMFRPDLFDVDDPSVLEARQLTWSLLSGSARAATTYTDQVSPEVTELGAWALVHGFATLAAGGAISTHSPDALTDIVREAASMMFREGQNS
ncbi:TetR family transcriptional regulator [Nocardioides albertanoniae]|uniref:TetR family transcriptional regulator n=1 Tax=Nocardioides albertanoniae TaxID=1175486 RepID=A0A543A4P7_9ACTN|nr:TetR/AcrR family transcriptional regulator [Nocardioides albertanoniae]TQL67573.1 TetR family transcriptional regulator [Nocardioides albertanoniae]